MNITITGYTDSKINAIKAVRMISDLGLKEAKEAVEAANEGINVFVWSLVGLIEAVRVVFG